MVGYFLELALVTEDTGGAWQNYQRLGFEPAPTGDIWPHAYGVVACEGIAIGLHASGDEPMGLVFVRPEVTALHRELSALGIEVEQARLGSDVFNELVLREPDGTAIRVLEARTFSPPLHLPAGTALGKFMSLSLPCRDLQHAQHFWQSIGMDCTPSGLPWDGLSIAGTPLACHQRRDCAEPVLTFRVDTLPAAGVFEAAGFARQKPLPALRAQPHAVARGAEGLAVLVLASV